MDLDEFKRSIIKEKFGINETFGRIFVFIDFANVNYWFEEDMYDSDYQVLAPNNKLAIDLKGLAGFSETFSSQARFYFGLDSSNKRSVGFISAAKKNFGEKYVFSKEIQLKKHYLKESEISGNTRLVNYDTAGQYVYIPKCNFDVEICVDAIRLLDHYETFCLFSSDADFYALARHLIRRGKKFILVKGGFTEYKFKRLAQIVIQAQDIKQYLTFIKQKSST